MGGHSAHTGIDSGAERRHFRLADYFDQYWDVYKQSPTAFITEEQYKAVSAMRVCRTEFLGVDHYVCPDCGEITQVYHSCKNRFCPTCSWKDTLAWADKIKADMLPIAHRHVVFTLPHGLNTLVKANKAELLDILFKCSADTIKDWMNAKYQLTPGIINVVHTFGEKKNLHPHIHMLLSWGGIDADYGVHSIKGEYIDYKFIRKKFRNKFEDKLAELFDAGVLKHHFTNLLVFKRFLKRINKKQWRINFESAMQDPAQVIRYIGRYSKRACISEYKITNIAGEYITFKYKDYKNKDFNGKPIVKELTLHYREFFPRLLQHVPLPYFRLVRYYGAYAARTKGLLKQKASDGQINTEPEQQEVGEEGEPLKICKHCQVEKLYLYTTYRNKEGERIYMSRFNPKKLNDKLKSSAA